jgi:hypothetical protein
MSSVEVEVVQNDTTYKIRADDAEELPTILDGIHAWVQSHRSGRFFVREDAGSDVATGSQLRGVPGEHRDTATPSEYPHADQGKSGGRATGLAEREVPPLPLARNLREIATAPNSPAIARRGGQLPTTAEFAEMAARRLPDPLHINIQALVREMEALGWRTDSQSPRGPENVVRNCLKYRLRDGNGWFYTDRRGELAYDPERGKGG